MLALGCTVTMKYPSVCMMAKGARGALCSIAFNAEVNTKATGAKMIHNASSSSIVSKSIARNGGKVDYLSWTSNSTKQGF